MALLEPPETDEPGGSGLPIATGQFLKERPLEGAAPEQSNPGLGVNRFTVMLDTVKLPVLLRAMAHVPLPAVALTVMVSDPISTPFEAADVELPPFPEVVDVDVELPPFIELAT